MAATEKYTCKFQPKKQMYHGQDFCVFVCAHLGFFRLFSVDNADQEMCGVHWKATKFSGSIYPQHEKRLCFKTSYSNDEQYKLTAVVSAAYHN